MIETAFVIAILIVYMKSTGKGINMPELEQIGAQIGLYEGKVNALESKIF